MPAPNPAPSVITDPLWRLWTDFDAVEATVLLSGIYAFKRGYHATRRDNERNWPGDYSIRLTADQQGPNDKSAGLDLTMSTAAMKRYTRRLDAAAKARDPRLYPGGRPVLREFIGTKDGATVYCYDLVARREMPGRSKTHLWHLHLSIIREFVNNWVALAGVLAVLTGQEEDDVSYSKWSNTDKREFWDDLQKNLGDSSIRFGDDSWAVRHAGFDPGHIATLHTAARQGWAYPKVLYQTVPPQLAKILAQLEALQTLVAQLATAPARQLTDTQLTALATAVRGAGDAAVADLRVTVQSAADDADPAREEAT